MDRRSSDEFSDNMSTLGARGAGDEDSLVLRSHRPLVKVALSDSHCGQSIEVDRRRLDRHKSSCVILAPNRVMYISPQFGREKTRRKQVVPLLTNETEMKKMVCRAGVEVFHYCSIHVYRKRNCAFVLP